LWDQYDIPNDETVAIDIVQRPQSIDFIKKKLLGEKLNREEIMEIMKDISSRRIREVEAAYFMACFFNPGFDDWIAFRVFMFILNILFGHPKIFFI